MQFNFNADVAEGVGNEALIMPYLQLCNVSCGAHAGSENEMEKAVLLAKQHNVYVGAHPSFEDQDNFGRVVLQLTANEIYLSVLRQLKLLQKITSKKKLIVNHVKPHGALYHLSCQNEGVAEAIVKATKEVRIPKIVGLPHSILETTALKENLTFLREGFADRTYQKDGSLVPRTQPQALLTAKTNVLQQVRTILQGKVQTINNTTVKLQVDTICFHGDTDGAVELLKHCYEKLS